ncbi:hypothetical protein JW935_01845 [candidate division KSB1 bacterium]|nr:hypothetical protein [candidate division KSB1 bacterium]
MSKRWQKPELVVLVRGKAEESVLAACKSLGGVPGDTGPFIGVNRCMVDATCTPQCVVKSTS